MKLELVKETKPNGTILYSIEKDGSYVNNTATTMLEEAERWFTAIENGSNSLTLKETIKTIEIDENKTN
jgi:hypothetical protein